MLDFRLKVFQSVALNQSFTKASNELFITQPAVSRHIKELEQEFEVKLFNRVGNKISLTEAGSLLLNYAERITALHNELKFEISQINGNQEGTLKIGASSTITQYVIPSVLATFNKKYPLIKLSLINGNTEFIEKQLLENKIDIGIVEGKPTNSDLKYSDFLNDELLIFCSSQNKTIPAVVNRESFAKLPLVLRERGSGTLEIIEKIILQNGIHPRELNVLINLGNTKAIKSFIETGVGVGIASRFAIERELTANLFRVIDADIKFNRQFYFISERGPEPRGLSKLFLDFVRNHYNHSL